MVGRKRPYEQLDIESLAIVRSTSLVSPPAVREHQHFVVHESQTVTEDDFWQTNADLLLEESARIAGLTQVGTSLLLQSHLPFGGPCDLERRRIGTPGLIGRTLLRVHLESDYFRQDRRRMGSIERGSGKSNEETDSLTREQQEARAAAVGTDHMFKQYNSQQQESFDNGAADALKRHKRGGK